MALFERSGLQQDTGLLRERWNQEGSTITDGTATHDGASSTETILTVSAGKTFYCKLILFTNGATSGAAINLTVKYGSTTKAIAVVPIGTTQQLVLESPLAFSTDVNVTSPGIWSITAVGWEE